MIEGEFIAAAVSLSVGAFAAGYLAGLARAYLRRLVSVA